MLKPITLVLTQMFELSHDSEEDAVNSHNQVHRTVKSRTLNGSLVCLSAERLKVSVYNCKLWCFILRKGSSKTSLKC